MQPYFYTGCQIKKSYEKTVPFIIHRSAVIFLQ